MSAPSDGLLAIEPVTAFREKGGYLSAQEPSGQRRWTLWLVSAAVILALIASFVTQNYETVEVRLLFWSVNVRLAWAVILAWLIGVLFGRLVPRRSRKPSRSRGEREVTHDPAG
jgi:uncharacterized integral membrane protein